MKNSNFLIAAGLIVLSLAACNSGSSSDTGTSTAIPAVNGAAGATSAPVGFYTPAPGIEPVASASPGQSVPALPNTAATSSPAAPVNSAGSTTATTAPATPFATATQSSIVTPFPASTSAI